MNIWKKKKDICVDLFYGGRAEVSDIKFLQAY